MDFPIKAIASTAVAEEKEARGTKRGKGWYGPVLSMARPLWVCILREREDSTE